MVNWISWSSQPTNSVRVYNILHYIVLFTCYYYMQSYDYLMNKTDYATVTVIFEHCLSHSLLFLNEYFVFIFSRFLTLQVHLNTKLSFFFTLFQTTRNKWHTLRLKSGITLQVKKLIWTNMGWGSLKWCVIQLVLVPASGRHSWQWY